MKILPQIGDFAESKKIYTSGEVIQFGQISGDENLLHLSEKFAQQTILKKRIVQGI